MEMDREALGMIGSKGVSDFFGAECCNGSAIAGSNWYKNGIAK